MTLGGQSAFDPRLRNPEQRSDCQKLWTGSWRPKKEANKQNTTLGDRCCSILWPHGLFLVFVAVFLFSGTGPHKKYREELSTAIQERSRMLGAFSHPLEPFTEVEES